MFNREKSSGMYDVWIYATAKFFSELPLALARPGIFLSILYFSIGFEDSLTEFIKFYIILELMIQASSGMGFCLSA